jgi:hypothetical protein
MKNEATDNEQRRMKNEVIFCFGSKPSFGISGRVSEISTSCFESQGKVKTPTAMRWGLCGDFIIIVGQLPPELNLSKRLFYRKYRLLKMECLYRKRVEQTKSAGQFPCR